MPFMDIIFGKADDSVLLGDLPKFSRRISSFRKAYLKKKFEALELERKNNPAADDAKKISMFCISVALSRACFANKRDNELDGEIKRALIQYMYGYMREIHNLEHEDWLKIVDSCKSDPVLIYVFPSLFDGSFWRLFMDERQNRIRDEAMKAAQRVKEQQEQKHFVEKITGLRAIIRESNDRCHQFLREGDQMEAYRHISRIEASQRAIDQLKSKLKSKISDSWEDKLRTG
jgi:hypothetical protein